MHSSSVSAIVYVAFFLDNLSLTNAVRGSADIRSLTTADRVEFVVNELAGAFRLHQYLHGKIDHVRELLTNQKGFPPATPRQIRFGGAGEEIILAGRPGVVCVFQKTSGNLEAKLRLKSTASPAIEVNQLCESGMSSI